MIFDFLSMGGAAAGGGGGGGGGAGAGGGGGVEVSFFKANSIFESKVSSGISFKISMASFSNSSVDLSSSEINLALQHV